MLPLLPSLPVLFTEGDGSKRDSDPIEQLFDKDLVVVHPEPEAQPVSAPVDAHMVRGESGLGFRGPRQREGQEVSPRHPRRRDQPIHRERLQRRSCKRIEKAVL